MRPFLITIWILCIRLSLPLAQTPLDVGIYLKTFQKQDLLVFQNEKLDWMNAQSYDIPLIKKMQFRTEMNGFNLQQQEYLFRAGLNSFKKINANSAYQSSVKSKEGFKTTFLASQLLKERYLTLVNFIGLSSILEKKQQQRILLQDRITFYYKSIAFPGFEVVELLRAEDELEKNERVILDLENQLLLTEKYIQRAIGNTLPIQVDRNLMIEIVQMKTIIDEINNQQIFHPQMAFLQAGIEERLLAFELEQSKSKFSPGFIQLRYNDDPKDDFQKKIAIGLGFDIPLKRTDRLDFNELQLDILDAQNVYKLTDQQLILKRNETYIQLQGLFNKYNLLEEQLGNNKATVALEAYQKIEEASPVVLLKLRESTLDKELLLEEIKHKIRMTFIDYLDQSGILSQQPYVNYLSRALETI